MIELMPFKLVRRLLLSKRIIDGDDLLRCYRGSKEGKSKISRVDASKRVCCDCKLYRFLCSFEAMVERSVG